MKKRNRLLRTLAIVVLIFAVAYWLLLTETALPNTCAFTFDVQKARALAASLPGDKSKDIRFERLTTFMFPGASVRAGAPWGMIEMPVFSYQLVFNDNTIIIDSAMNETQAQALHAEAYDKAAWNRLEHALQNAAEVYVTHEHGDHMGGIFADQKALYAHAKLTPEQLAPGKRLQEATISAAALATLKPLNYEGMHAVAPGVVLIKAPGHTPGSQWVFVTDASGNETLFVGDTAWQTSNIDFQQGPPRLTSLLLHNARDANACQLMALHRLHENEKSLEIVPGHDGKKIQDLVAAGRLKQEFYSNP